MNSTLNDEFTDAHAPLSTSVASSSSLKSGFYLCPSHSDDRECLHSTLLTDEGGAHMCALDRAESSCSDVDVDPLWTVASNYATDKPSIEFVKSSVPIAMSMPRAPLSTTIHSPSTHKLVSANGLFNSDAMRKGSCVELPFVPIQSKTLMRKSKMENIDQSSGSDLPSSPAKTKQTQSKAKGGSTSADEKEQKLTQIPSLSKEEKEKKLIQIPSLSKESSGVLGNGLSVYRVSFVSHTPVTRSSSKVEDTVVSPHPTTKQKVMENMSKNIPTPSLSSVFEDNVDSLHPATNQKALRNLRENDHVLLWRPPPSEAQSTHFQGTRVTRPNLSPWFSTLNTSCGASQVSCNLALTSSEKLSTNTTTTSHSSSGRTGHEEPSSTSKDISPASSNDTQSSRCLRSSCKDGNCQVNVTPSSEKSSSNGASDFLFLIEREESCGRSLGASSVCSTDSCSIHCHHPSNDGNCRDNMTPSSEKSSTDSMQIYCSSVERSGLVEEPSMKSLEKNHPLPACSTDTHCSYCLRSSCKDGNCRANLVPSSPTSEKTSGNAPFAPLRSDEVSKPAMAKMAAATARALKQANDWGSKTATPTSDAHSGFLSIDSHPVPHDEKTPISPPDGKKARLTPLSLIDEPFSPPPTTQRSGVKTTLQWLMDYTKNAVSENAQINDTKTEVSLLENIKKREDARKKSDFGANSPSSNVDGSLWSSRVDEKPTKCISSLPPPSSESQTSLPQHSVEEKPAILNPFTPACLFDFANTYLSLPAGAKQESDPVTSIAITEQQSMKSRKRSRDAASRSTCLPAKKVNQTTPMFSSGDMTSIPTISCIEKTSPVSTRPKGSKKPIICDPSSSKGSIPEVTLHKRLHKVEKRPRESDSSFLKLNVVDVGSPSEQQELARSSHQPHNPCQGGKSSRNLRDAYSGHRNKRRKTFQPSFGPTDCCRPRNAFILYSMKERQQIAAAHPHAQFGEISKLVASSWHRMSDAEKKPYRKLASEEANKYHNEVCKSHQTWEHLASRGLQILYVVDLVCEWLSQKLPRWAKTLALQPMALPLSKYRHLLEQQLYGGVKMCC
ncbi:hypothetical protein GOP47_0025551 [Adiantum capillus-veneris]|uniref:HMG box domain-containing protein n=1 Tax=Adiantum capillus-veneris TaxID=13818 RepID=A0A9D4U150_ADICA|nr:hypothetical protein GOP47_0025551 [Adiantum capillus-veneris]